MNIEEDIRQRFQQGLAPSDLVRMGYRKSTVYKVYNMVRGDWIPVNKSGWLVNGITFGKDRYLPGQTANFSLNFENASDQDLYLLRVGVQPEWERNQIDGQWNAREVKELLKPRQKRFFSFNLAIPKNLSLNEYDIYFGIEGQYLPGTSYPPPETIQWCEPPLVLNVKQPLTRYHLFISHSTSDLQLIRDLEWRLDLNGIDATIAEDIPEPGADVWQKIMNKIQACTVFLAIITDEAARSEWVQKEIKYAKEINKPLLLFKEKDVNMQSSVEWVVFSGGDTPDQIFPLIMDALRKMEEQGKISNPVASIIGLGILAVLAGLFLGGDK